MAMSNVMDVFARVAAAHGNLDASGTLSVQHFFEHVAPTLSPEEQQQIFDEVFAGTTGLSARFEDYEAIG